MLVRSEGSRARDRAEVSALAQLINEQLWIGHFDLWSRENIVTFRHSLVRFRWRGAGQSRLQCGAIVSEALKACENYYQAFQFVLWSGKGAHEALELAMFETQGTA